MIKTENKLKSSQKRVIYIVLVMLLLASVTILVYLVFILINSSNRLIEMNDGTAGVVGGILAILGAMFGAPIGKKWWQIVYIEKEHGAFLKVKK